MTWEQRWHPLREEWVIVAAHRQNRPWTGDRFEGDEEDVPAYDADCYLCPGNKRVSGIRNPDYEQIHVFDNDHPCVGFDAPEDIGTAPGPYTNLPARGIARVVCYTPQHNRTLAELSPQEILALFHTWQRQYEELGKYSEVKNVLIFENKGKVVGVSNPHAHCQIYATNFIVNLSQKQARVSREYLETHGRPLFQEIIKTEQEHEKRIIHENSSAIAFVPYFARYAYEAYVAPKNTYQDITEIPESEIKDVAAALKSLLVKYDNLWKMSFPYVMLLYQAPTNGSNYPGFHFHFELFPPLRTPSLKKYLGGPEIGGGNFLSDTDPDEKARELRGQPATHYKDR